MAFSSNYGIIFLLLISFNILEIRSFRSFVKINVCRSKLNMSSDDRTIPKPNIITPNAGTKSNIDKFLMMYTCKQCGGRNAQMVNYLYSLN
jgi:hypothetical protein